MGDCMLVQQNLLLILAKLLTNFIEINDAIIYGFLVIVVLTDSKTFWNRLQTLL